MLKSNIGPLVKNSGLRKSFIAEKLKVSVRQFRKYETGEAFPPLDKAHILARLLSVKVDDLHDFVEEEEL